MTVARLVPSRIEGSVLAPPSKSYTHRFLLAAHLSGRAASVRRPLSSDDTVRTARALQVLGTHVTRGRSAWRLSPRAATRKRNRRTIACGESGTTLRLMTAIAALEEGPTRFEGSGRLPRRPMRPLWSALARLGARIEPLSVGEALPFRVTGPIHGGRTVVGAGASSQFTSALLLALPTCREDSSVGLRGRPVSEPYVRATLEVLERSGVHVGRTRDGYRIPGGQTFRPLSEPVPGDASSAAYLWAAAALTGGRITVRGLPQAWPQADLAVLDLLRASGAGVRWDGDRATVRAGERRPFRAELTSSPDLYPLAGVLAATTPGRSELRGAPQVVAKESDRRAETLRLARALGARATLSRGRLIVEGVARPRPLRLLGLSDHRLVMSAAVAAVAASGPSEIADASAVAKSFPGFFAALRSVGAEVTVR
jgi:3-phosphoshikimate 1-carboxyvinyltransferase